MHNQGPLMPCNKSYAGRQEYKCMHTSAHTDKLHWVLAIALKIKYIYDIGQRNGNGFVICVTLGEKNIK